MLSLGAWNFPSAGEHERLLRSLEKMLSVFRFSLSPPSIEQVTGQTDYKKRDLSAPLDYHQMRINTS